MQILNGTHISVEDNDEGVLQLLKKVPGPLPAHANDQNDWILMFIDVKEHNPVEGDLYIFQHLGKVGDSGYYCFRLINVFRNRSELDILASIFDGHSVIAKGAGDSGRFPKQCADMVRAMKLGTSLAELARSGIAYTPPPSQN